MIGVFVLIVLLGGALLASQSKAGLLVLVGIVCVAILLRLRSALKYWYVVVPAIITVVVSFFLIDTAKDNFYTNRLKVALHFFEPFQRF